MDIGKLNISPNYLLFAIIVVGAGLRIFASFGAGLEWYSTDTYSYYRQAESILSGDPKSNFPNGYPIIIAIIKAIFPDRLVPNVNIFLNIILSTLTIYNL